MACIAVSQPDTGDICKTGTLSLDNGYIVLCCGFYILSKQISWLITPRFTSNAFPEFLSLWSHSNLYWEEHAIEKVNTHTHMLLAKIVSLLSGKCISSCQHFCSLLDWALCSAVTPLQEASSPPNSRAICPGSRLATSIPTHPCLSASGLRILLWVPGLEHVPGIRGGQALFVRM